MGRVLCQPVLPSSLGPDRRAHPPQRHGACTAACCRKQPASETSSLLEKSGFQREGTPTCGRSRGPSCAASSESEKHVTTDSTRLHKLHTVVPSRKAY